MLQSILETIRDAHGPVSLRDISHKLDLDESTVTGMIEFLIRKGLIQDDSKRISSCPTGVHCSGCSGVNSCPFSSGPKTYSLKKSTRLKT